MRLCASDRMQPALLLVRHGIQFLRRPQDDRPTRSSREVERLSPDGGLVELTGGEPMLQERELVPFMEQLIDAGYTVLLETSGERPLSRFPNRSSRSST